MTFPITFQRFPTMMPSSWLSRKKLPLILDHGKWKNTVSVLTFILSLLCRLSANSFMINVQEDFGFQTSVDSGFHISVDSGFQSTGFRIPKSKISWIPDSGYCYMGRLVSRNMHSEADCKSVGYLKAIVDDLITCPTGREIKLERTVAKT